MKSIGNEQVEELLEDIASNKEYINKLIIQELIDLSHFMLLIFLSGLGIFGYIDQILVKLE